MKFEHVVGLLVWILVGFIFYYSGYSYREHIEKDIIDCYTKNHGEYNISHDICIVSNKYKIIEVK